MEEDITQVAIEAENGAERAIKTNSHQSDQGEKIDVRRKKIGTVTIYDVTESELTILEKGTDASIWLNFFIATISIAASFFATLLTVDWGERITITQVIFICVTIIMTLAAIICFVFWRKTKGQHEATIKTIKERTFQENC